MISIVFFFRIVQTVYKLEQFSSNIMILLYTVTVVPQLY